MFPAFTEMVEAFLDTTRRGEMLAYAWSSVYVLLLGYAVGVGSPRSSRDSPSRRASAPTS